MVRFLSVEQLQMQRAARRIGEPLKEFSRQAEAKRARHVLALFRRADSLELQLVQSAPYEVRPAAEIDNTSRQAFVHRHIGFPGEGIARIEPCSVATNP